MLDIHQILEKSNLYLLLFSLIYFNSFNFVQTLHNDTFTRDRQFIGQGSFKSFT